VGGPFLRLPLFEGPLDLLLHLARREAIPLRELPLAQVTAQFLAYIDVMRALEIEVCGEFIEVAALLCLLKSRELLPPADGPDDEGPAGDPREALIDRLVEYASFRHAAGELDSRPRMGRDFFVRPDPGRELVQLREDEAESLDVDLLDMLGALRDLLERRRRAEPLYAAPQAVEPIEDRMRLLLERLVADPSLGLHDLLGDGAARPALVTAFLAILELARRGWIAIRAGAEGIRVERRFDGAAPVVGVLA
jgi:segregation and condensation protein A